VPAVSRTAASRPRSSRLYTARPSTGIARAVPRARVHPPAAAPPLPADPILAAANAIVTADFLLIGAGAGMSADSGLPVYNGIADVAAYRAMRVSYADLCDPSWIRRDPEIFFGFWGWCFNTYIKTQPHAGYQMLLRWARAVQDRAGSPLAAHVYTSNVDGFFLKAGFPEACVTEFHGSCLHWQCSSPCSFNTWTLSPKFRFCYDTRTMRAPRFMGAAKVQLPRLPPMSAPASSRRPPPQGPLTGALAPLSARNPAAEAHQPPPPVYGVDIGTVSSHMAQRMAALALRVLGDGPAPNAASARPPPRCPTPNSLARPGSRPPPPLPSVPDPPTLPTARPESRPASPPSAVLHFPANGLADLTATPAVRRASVSSLSSDSEVPEELRPRLPGRLPIVPTPTNHPACPRCMRPARPHVLMFDDDAWIDRGTPNYKAFRRALKAKPDARVVLLELGCGTRIPTIRDAFEALGTRLGARATLVRVNPADTDPGKLRGACAFIPIASGALDALAAINARMQSTASQPLQVPSPIKVPRAAAHATERTSA
jgi:NAD-dependent SIR2 family protein deacetylase